MADSGFRHIAQLWSQIKSQSFSLVLGLSLKWDAVHVAILRLLSLSFGQCNIIFLGRIGNSLYLEVVCTHTAITKWQTDNVHIIIDRFARVDFSAEDVC